MADTDPIKRRWAEDSPEEPAAKLLSQVLRPTPSVTQLMRVRARLAESVRAAPVAPVFLRWSLVQAAFVLSVGLLAGALGYSRLRPAAPRLTGGTAVGAPAQLALLGPGQVIPGSGSVPTRLLGGALLIRTTDAPTIIEEAQARLTVPLHALVEVVSSHGRPTLIASYLGQAVVRWAGREQEVLLAAGSAATAAGLVALPAGRLQRVAAWLARLESPGNQPLPPLGVEVMAAGVRALEAPATEPAAPSAAKTSPPVEKPLPPRPGTPPLRSATQTAAAGGAPPLPGRDPRSRVPTPATPKRAGVPPAKPAPPTSPALADAKGGEEAILKESQALGAAMARLRQAHDPAGALALLDSYRQQFPHGLLQPEAELLRITALLGVGKRREALTALDQHPLADDTPRGMELRVTRGELRAAAGRCAESLADFTAAIAQVQGELLERGLYGRSSCRAQRGDAAGARADLTEYLRRFPSGRFSAAARRTLSLPEAPKSGPPAK